MRSHSPWRASSYAVFVAGAAGNKPGVDLIVSSARWGHHRWKKEQASWASESASS